MALALVAVARYARPMAKRVIIIGAGIIGASLAWHLAEAGADVLVLDREAKPGGIATPKSWAWINASWGNDAAYARLRFAAMDGWRRLDREIPGLQVNWCGGLLWDLPMPDLETFVKERQGEGYDIRLIGKPEIMAREPNLRHVPEIAALADGEGAVEPEHAVACLMAAAQSRGADVACNTDVKWLEVSDDRVTGVMTADGVLSADHVVIAAGAGAVNLMESVNLVLAVDQPPGLISHSEPAPELLTGLLMAPELHVRQTTEGRLVAGTDFGGMDPGNDLAKAAAELHAQVQAMIAGAEKVSLSHFGIGYRPTPRDGVSCVGAVPGLAGLTLAVTHSGITLAPALGVMLADEILGGERDPLLRHYGPGRLLSAKT